MPCDFALLAADAIARYVSGDFRFRNGYCRSNPRKMVQVWAEKEMRNLMRLRQVSMGCNWRACSVCTGVRTGVWAGTAQSKGTGRRKDHWSPST